MTKILFFLIFLIPHAFSKDIKNLTFSQIKNIPDQVIGAKLLENIYSKIGIKIKFEHFSGKRALAESSKGVTDGEVTRIFRIGKAYKTLLRVPTPISYIESSGFVKVGSSIEASKWSDLKLYRVGRTRGVLHAELGTKGFKRVLVITNPKQHIPLILRDRIDVFVEARFNGLILIKKYNASGKIIPLNPSFQKLDIYHYLHKKNKHLINKLNDVILEMKKTGELSKLREKYIKEYLNNVQIIK